VSTIYRIRSVGSIEGMCRVLRGLDRASPLPLLAHRCAWKSGTGSWRGMCCVCLHSRGQKTTSLDCLEAPKHVCAQAWQPLVSDGLRSDLRTYVCTYLRDITTSAHLCTTSQATAHVHNITSSSKDSIAAMCLLLIFFLYGNHQIRREECGATVQCSP
jgi:hypothetical protein